MKMLPKEECEKALDYISDKWLSGTNLTDLELAEHIGCFSALIREHFELVDLIEKWGLNDLSIEELDKWHDRVIWHIQKCDELHNELTKLNDYYFKLEKTIQTLFGVSADDILMGLWTF